MRKKRLYLIPGLGVDSRLFQKQQESGLEFTVLEWLNPGRNETLEEYAKRMSVRIGKDTPFVLAGVSMGGIVAQEIAQFVTPEKIIIISSIRNCGELPPHFRIFRTLPVHRLIPDFLYRFTPVVAVILRPVFGKMSPADQKAFRDMVKDSDPWFIKWAIDRVINWKRKYPLENVIQISGDSDHVFPKSFIQKPDYSIEGGSHFMIRTRAAEINKILMDEAK